MIFLGSWWLGQWMGPQGDRTGLRLVFVMLNVFLL